MTDNGTATPEGRKSKGRGGRPRSPNRYQQLIERVFFLHYQEGQSEVEFSKEEYERIASELDIVLPKNQPDIIYTFRHRAPLPQSVLLKAPAGKEWVIVGAGRGRYSFVAKDAAFVVPSQMLSETKVPDATPGVISKYALSDEQALLAKLRYNRLIDIFTGVTCYSLQSHLRTQVVGLGQVETDELYIGVDRRGAHYIVPVQAKGGRDKLGIVQIEQDFALCAAKFPQLICRPIGAQFMHGDLIALFEFEQSQGSIRITLEKHYRLVPPDEVTTDDLLIYRSRAS